MYLYGGGVRTADTYPLFAPESKVCATKIGAFHLSDNMHVQVGVLWVDVAVHNANVHNVAIGRQVAST